MSRSLGSTILISHNKTKRIVLISLFLCTICYNIIFSYSYMAKPLFHINMNEMNQVRKCKNVALILFGVPVHFDHIWKLYTKYIVERNPHIHFEVYMHVYSDLHEQPLTSVRNNIEITSNARPQAPDVIRKIFDQGSIPANMTTSSQSTFDELELSWLKQSDTIGFWDYPLQTLKNIFRQGNSLKQSFLHSTRSEKNPNAIDLYIFARSDTILLSPIEIPCSGIGDNEIRIPSWGSWSGVNDRFAIAGPHAAKFYASRMDGYKEAILARRANNATLEVLGNSESMLKKWLEQNSLNITLMGEDWAKLSRVRVNGIVHFSDHVSHIANLSNGTIQPDKNGNMHNVHVAAVAEMFLGSNS